MVSEKAVGGLMLLASIVVIVLYFIWGILAPLMLDNPADLFWKWNTLWGIPIPPLYWLIMLPLFLVLLVGGVIFGWIGLALIQSPEPSEINIEEIEKELEELEKEEEEKKEEKEEEEKEESD